MNEPGARVEEGFVLRGHATRFAGKFDRLWGGRRLVDRVVDSVAAAGLSATIVSTDPLPGSTVPVLHDPFDRGPLGGVRAILHSRGTGPFFVVGADMPMVRPDAIRRLIAVAAPGISVVPKWSDGTLEVLHAIYDPPVDAVVRYWEAQRSLRDLVRDLEMRGQARSVPAEEFDPSTFTDVDTADDLERVRSGRMR